MPNGAFSRTDALVVICSALPDIWRTIPECCGCFEGDKARADDHLETMAEPNYPTIPKYTSNRMGCLPGLGFGR